MNNKHFQVFVDTGGTFTDCIAVDSSGVEHRKKVLSSGCLRGEIKRRISDSSFKIEELWGLEKDIIKGFQFRLLPHEYEHKIQSYDVLNGIISLSSPLNTELDLNGLSFEITSGEEAPVVGIRMITQTALNESFPELLLKLGSTKGTNALLERKGAKTLFLVTKGFKDLLVIGNQARPDIFAMSVNKRRQLTDYIIEVNERIDTNGKVLDKLDSDQLTRQLNDLNPEGIDSVAITFMNAYRNPEHEVLAKDLVESLGYRFISISSELSPLIKILPRAETTVVNAYLSPIIHNYINNIKASINDKSFQVMTSAGGLVSADQFYPKDSLLSGPAGGVVGAAIVGERLGYSKLITFDMGGTSTDVSRYNGNFDYRYELEVGDSLINSSAIAIETVAAGGGSICGFDGYKLFVGPESASAIPGPACYGAGGPLTITDVNLLLGRLDSSHFGIPVFKNYAEEKLQELLNNMAKISGKEQNRDQVLNGFIDIANEIMAGAIRRISISKGYNPKDFALVAFGGAGGLHACDIADILGISTIILPGDAGLLSAYGIGNARIERFAEKQILQPFNEAKSELSDWFLAISQKSISLLMEEGFRENEIGVRQQMLFLRFKGQDNSIEIDYNESDVLEAFHNKYFNLYGHRVNNREVEVEAIRVIASVNETEMARIKPLDNFYTPEPHSGKDTNLYPVFKSDKLSPGAEITAPALYLNSFSATSLKNGWGLKLQSDGSAILIKSSEVTPNHIEQTAETELELFTNRFMSIAENMGALLQRTALSVNIKERLDFSCALLDADGKLVANAPHIPVHLGGLGVCVQTLLKNFSFDDGDTMVTNHPGFGGSHLPDVTLITPVFYNGKRIAFVVNRAHHSEIGGISPGSMPPDAKNLCEEGVVIFPFYLVKSGEVNWAGMQDILEKAPYPTRAVQENLADLNAGLAANINGKQALLDLVEQFGIASVKDHFNLLFKHASSKIKETLSSFPNGSYYATEYLDDGSILKVRVELENEFCIIDFSGSADVHDGNMNATIAIVNSVVFYVLRLLLNAPIPLNDGLMEPVKLILPKGMLNPEFVDDITRCPAVVGGNVEISMRLTDTLLKAFGLMAASQGTMNNTLFGNERFGYYETICGGCGAGKGFNGADAVHHHMTNTRITDPEIMEHRYPVRLEEFSVRKNSGGKGKWIGGNGVKRHLTFLEQVNLSVLSQRRKSGPYGLNGGADGKVGKQYVIRTGGEKILLNSISNIDLEKGDQFVIETPGGGGYESSKR